MPSQRLRDAGRISAAFLDSPFWHAWVAMEIVRVCRDVSARRGFVPSAVPAPARDVSSTGRERKHGTQIWFAELNLRSTITIFAGSDSPKGRPLSQPRQHKDGGYFQGRTAYCGERGARGVAHDRGNVGNSGCAKFRRQQHARGQPITSPATLCIQLCSQSANPAEYQVSPFGPRSHLQGSCARGCECDDNREKDQQGKPLREESRIAHGCTASTGRPAIRTTRYVVEPNTASSSAFRPRTAITIRSTFLSAAN